MEDLASEEGPHFTREAGVRQHYSGYDTIGRSVPMLLQALGEELTSLDPYSHLLIVLSPFQVKKTQSLEVKEFARGFHSSDIRPCT